MEKHHIYYVVDANCPRWHPCNVLCTAPGYIRPGLLIGTGVQTMSSSSQDRVDEKVKELSVASDVEAATDLSEVYRRHGRTDLVPMPSVDPSDPYNWPT